MNNRERKTSVHERNVRLLWTVTLIEALLFLDGAGVLSYTGPQFALLVWLAWRIAKHD